MAATPPLWHGGTGFCSTPKSRPAHRWTATAETRLRGLFQCFCLSGGGVRKPVAVVAGGGRSVLVPCAGAVGGTSAARTGTPTTRPASRNTASRAQQQRPTTGDRRESKETPDSAVADVATSRRARATLAHPPRAVSPFGGRPCRPSRWQGCTSEHIQPFWWHAGFTLASTRLSPLRLAH